MGVVITIHELGHYYAGRKYGAAIESFSFGFGKPIFERRDKRGTRWRINRWLLGGFVMFVQEKKDAEPEADVEVPHPEIVGKPYKQLTPGQRSVVAIAGPLANFVLAVVLMGLVVFANGKDKATLSVTQVTGQPSIEAGFKVGDQIVTVAGKKVDDRNDLQIPMRLGTGNRVPVSVQRSGELINLEVVPVRQEVETAVGTKARMGVIGLGFEEQDKRKEYYGPVTSLWVGAVDAWETTAITVKMLGRIITMKESIHNLSGPVGIGDVGRRVTNQTLGAEQAPLGQRIWAFSWSMIQICALVSIGIGLFNLLPLPVLDGGHLVFNAYEAMTGKVMPERVIDYSYRFGLVLLLSMALLVTYGDVLETGIFGS